MPDARWSRVNRRRIVWTLVCLGALLLVAWAGPAVWWAATECRATCAPNPGAGQLRLSSGATLPLLDKATENGTLFVDYVTQVLRDDRRLCPELREVVQTLQANGELASTRKALISPHDPHTRMLGITWHGPVFSCCVSTGVIFRRAEDGRWNVSAGPCKGQIEAAPPNKRYLDSSRQVRSGR
jgi:hypothetical protein